MCVRVCARGCVRHVHKFARASVDGHGVRSRAFVHACTCGWLCADVRVCACACGFVCVHVGLCPRVYVCGCPRVPLHGPGVCSPVRTRIAILCE